MLVDPVAPFREEDVMEDASYQDFIEPPAPEMWRWTNMKRKHIYKKLGVPEMWRCPLAIFPVVLWHICHETDNQPFALILKDNCDDCWQDVGRAAEQGLSLPILWDELCPELAAEEVPILSWSFLSTINIIKALEDPHGRQAVQVLNLHTHLLAARLLCSPSSHCPQGIGNALKLLRLLTTYTTPSVCEPKCCCRWSPTMSLA